MWRKGTIIFLSLMVLLAIGVGYAGIILHQQVRNYVDHGCIQVKDIPVTEWLNNQVTIHKDWLAGYWVCRN